MSEDQALVIINGIINNYLDEEEAIASTAKSDTYKTIYSDRHYLYNILSHMYPNMFLEEQRSAYEKIINDEKRAQYIKRLRVKAFEVATITGIDTVKKIIRNQIDYLVLASGVQGIVRTRALRRELELFYLRNSTLWFSAMVVPYYSVKFIAHINKRASVRSDTGSKTQTKL